MQRRMVARQHAELRRQVAVLIGILELQRELAGRDPLYEEPEEEQQQQQRPAALPHAQAEQRQGTHAPELIWIHLWRLA